MASAAKENHHLGEPCSPARRALALFQNFKAAESLADSALLSGDASLLAQAESLGWSPSLAPSSGGPSWIERAMADPSGASIRWMLERFPMECANFPPLQRSSEKVARDDGSSSHNWSSSAMSEMQDLGIGIAGLSSWTLACCGSKDAPAYFTRALREESPWAASAAPKDSALAHHLRLSLLPVAHFPDDELLANACSQFVAHQLDGASLSHAEHAPLLLQILGQACWMSSEGHNIEPLSPAISLLPNSSVNLALFPLRIDGNLDAFTPNEDPPSRAQEKSLLSAMNHLSSLAMPSIFLKSALSRDLRSPNGIRNELERSLNLGLAALFGPSKESFEYVLSRGWLGSSAARVAYSCQDPVAMRAYASKGLKAKGAAKASTSQCRLAIECSSLPAAERLSLLARCEPQLPEPECLPDGVIPLYQDFSLSPVLLLILTCSHSWGLGSSINIDMAIDRITALASSGLSIAAACQGSPIAIAVKVLAESNPPVRALAESQAISLAVGHAPQSSSRRL